MNKQKKILEVKNEFKIKRAQKEYWCDRLIDELNEENEEFKKVYSELIKKKILLSTSNNSSTLYKEEIKQLEESLTNILKPLNLDLSALEPDYDCPFCEDTGGYNGKLCQCLLNEVTRQMSLNMSCQKTFKSFDDCNSDIMDKTDMIVYKKLLSWCESYPDNKIININLLGKPGSGKTFFLECLANQLIVKGIITCFTTAFEFNELARQYHIGQNSEWFDYIKADVLIIDDLGSETMFNNVTKEYLYNIINMRQVNKLPTLISSNLTPNDILERYGERIFSRLANRDIAITIELTSDDKRLKTKEKESCINLKLNTQK